MVMGRLGPHMHFHIPFSAMRKPRFFACCEVCSLLVIYVPDLVICVLPSAIKITFILCCFSMMFFYNVWLGVIFV